MASASSATKCDACGLPPRDPSKPLLQCTRCHGAYYHDAACQRKHYPTHKAECRRAAASVSSSSYASSPKPPKQVVSSSSLAASPSVPSYHAPSSSVECRLDTAKGRCLFATKALPIGCHPFAATTKADAVEGLCESIVHPVLFEHLRKFRCAFCFRNIPDNNNIKVPANSTKFLLHHHCSTECRKLDTNWLMEEQAVRNLPSPPSSTVLSCSRLIRKFIQFPSSVEEFNSLSPGTEWIPTLKSTDEKVKDLAIIMTECKLFLKAMGDHQGASLVHTIFSSDLLTASQLIRRIHTNGFTISDGEQNNIGVGLYLSASVINHSCRPNVIQTFWLRSQKPPMLQLTVVTPIQVGEEMTISYCDSSMPRLDRRGALLQEYSFICNCHFCQDTNLDDDIYGLKCIKKSCDKKGARIRSMKGKDLLDEYRCELCGHNRSEEETQSLQQLYSRMHASSDPFHSAVDAERKAYSCMRSSCQLETSYFFALCSKQFISTICRSLPFIADEGERMNLIGEALSAMNDSKAASKFCFDYPGSLQWTLQRGEEAKLRLYANPTDVEAWNLLKEVKSKMLKYYPPCDETIQSLDESLESYSWFGR